MRFVVLLFLASGPLALAAWGQLRVVGSIPCAGGLEVAAPPRLVTVTNAGRSARLRIETPEKTSAAVGVNLRSNCAYRVEAQLAGPQELTGVAVPLLAEEIVAAGGTGHLASNALSARFTASELRPGAPATIGGGPRISSGGTDSTVDNAILVRMRLEIPAGFAGSDVILTLRLE